MPVKKVLVADDEPNVVALIASRLTTLGYDIATAADGEETIAKTKALKPDLLILDVLMPKLTGFEVLKRIRQDREFSSIPAIVISAKGSMKDFFAGMSDVQFVPKPYDAKALVQAIEDLLGGGLSGQKRTKNVIILGVEDNLLKKVKECLEKFGFEIYLALTEEEAVKLANKWHPIFILSQFWEDPNILDPKRLAENISRDKYLAKTPIFVFCKQGPLMLDAMKTFKDERLIGYSDSSELLARLKELHEAKIFV